MRPTARHQSALRTPLNDLLGTEAHVRLLRALSATETPVSASELARQTDLHLSGIGRALVALEETGVVELVGTGGRRPARLRDVHPLAPVLRTLFRAEAARFEHIVHSLREAAKRVRPIPKAIWIQGPVTRGEDRIGDPLVIALLTSAKDLVRARTSLEALIEDLERDLDVTVEIRGYTVADFIGTQPHELAAVREGMSLLGPPPLSLVQPAYTRRDRGATRPASRSRIRSHADIDARAHALAGAIAERLRSDPSLVGRARARLSERLETASASDRHALREWDRILRTMSVARLRRFLIDPGERATRLRQTLPFAEVLSAEERGRIAATASDRRDSGSRS